MRIPFITLLQIYLFYDIFSVVVHYSPKSLTVKDKQATVQLSSNYKIFNWSTAQPVILQLTLLSLPYPSFY